MGEPFRFDVGFSCTGPHRDKMRAIAELVRTNLGDGKVFFDDWFEHEIRGIDMGVLLQDFYRRRSRMVVADFSSAYADREWTRAEARVIQELRKQLQTERGKAARLRLLNLRFEEGGAPADVNAEDILDCANKTVVECADLIIRRHRLLLQLMGAQAGPLRPGADGGQNLPCAGPTAMGHHGTWVWHSTLASRTAGKVSILACAETLCAVTLYWWVALRYDTHWHLVSSVFIAPILLLRSPKSMAAGVQWFLNDWFAFTRYEQWTMLRKLSWMGIAALISSLPAYSLVRRMNQALLPGIAGEPLLGWAATAGASSIAIAIVFARFLQVGTAPSAGADVGVATGTTAGAVTGAVTGAFTGAVFPLFADALVGAIIGAVTGAFAVALVGAFVGSAARAINCSVGVAAPGAALSPSIGAGIAMRGFFFRMVATLRFLPAGAKRLPENWRENNFLTDSFIPAELMPGIRNYRPEFALDGWSKKSDKRQGILSWVFRMFMGTCFFLPAFLYRLNIKSTAWFWWPLAYLLRPAPVTNADAQQKQALCWPWTNPFQKALIVASVLLVITSLAVHYFEPVYWSVTKTIPGLTLPLKVMFAIDWAHIAPWHWAQWIIAGAGAYMLALAGNARSHDINGNWQNLRNEWPKRIRQITSLQRLRTLATIALLLMALGALLLQDRGWQAYVSIPETWIKALNRFYRIQG